MKSAVTFLRRIALAEAVSYLLLLGIAMPLKYMAEQPLAVRLVGSIHGLLFVVFCWALWKVWTRAAWPWQRCALVMVVSLIPIAPFIFDKQMRVWEAQSAA